MIDADHAISPHKVIMIDGEVFITRRFNFTRVALGKNAGNVLILPDPALAVSIRRVGTPTGGIVSRPWAEVCASHGGAGGESARRASHSEAIPYWGLADVLHCRDGHA